MIERFDDLSTHHGEIILFRLPGFFIQFSSGSVYFRLLGFGLSFKSAKTMAFSERHGYRQGVRIGGTYIRVLTPRN